MRNILNSTSLGLYALLLYILLYACISFSTERETIAKSKASLRLQTVGEANKPYRRTNQKIFQRSCEMNGHGKFPEGGTLMAKSIVVIKQMVILATWGVAMADVRLTLIYFCLGRVYCLKSSFSKRIYCFFSYNNIMSKRISLLTRPRDFNVLIRGFLANIYKSPMSLVAACLIFSTVPVFSNAISAVHWSITLALVLF